jgi:hypothetical protein
MAHGDHPADTLPEGDQPSLVERLFPAPKTVSEGEYIAIYEFLLNPDICNDPVAIAGCLGEFAGWAQYMLTQMGKQSLLELRNEKRPSPSEQG